MSKPRTFSQGWQSVGLWVAPLLIFGAASAWKLSVFALPLRLFGSLAVWIPRIAQNTGIEDLFDLLWACLRCSAS